MGAYVLKRLVAVVPVLVGITVVVFLTMHLSPGDPALIMLGPHATEPALAQLRHDLGLDLPIAVQYVRWIGKLVSGDWGHSIQLKRSVIELLGARAGGTALLAVSALVLAVGLGLPAGVLAAVWGRSAADRALMIAMLAGFSMPVFWLGLLLQLGFGLRLGWFPISGMYAPGSSDASDLVRHLVLPAVALAVGPAATVARMTRASMLDVARQEYIRAARARGVGRWSLVFRHGLRNAMIPTVTVIGMQAGYLLGGEVLVEMLFNWPGLGMLMINGILARDFPVVQGGILVISAMYVFTNLAVDVLYAYLDPRITYA
ncbi:ABC transporter permease [Carboxydochorda subterranea]|uniref:ABC transporter permease n=1 Tax=Carboxydichorda subterranea TaxID=3109565 RepID=A0ABZ1BWM1_9FIRM|nr:ABC transporter permease [Limnochorda sp. L945t]WRP17201.1 ABC transporter permease [Limnochorda sp. L945t]